jgi:L-threonylcarbamoyladenylate synthase
MPLLDGQDSRQVAAAAAALMAGELVAFPTETVYGLGARADDDTAVARIFEAKGRPADHPLIVHVNDVASAQRFAADWPELAQRLADAFWPGPLTLIVRRRPAVAGAAAAGQDTIGLRCPSHPVAQALLAEAQRLGVPGVAAPSANRFGRLSPTRASHVQAEFAQNLPELRVLDGGECEVGIESTIVDLSRGHPMLLRPGQLSREQLETVTGERLGDGDAGAPRASGTLEAHYAPTATLRLMSAMQLRAALGVLGDATSRPVPGLAVYSRTVKPGRNVRHCQMAAEAAGAAHELYGVLREIDDGDVRLIWVEDPPDAPEWEGVRDRLRRAAAAA